MSIAAASLGLRYLTEPEVTRLSATLPPLGVVGLGAARPAALPAGCPFVRLDLPLLSGEPAYEVWTAGPEVSYATGNGIALAASPSLTFGSLSVAERPEVDLDQLACDAYGRLFELADSGPHRHFLRIWNYFPGITEDAAGLERYRRFNRGRHEAFAARRRLVDQAPAASALGSASGPVRIHFLLARDPGAAVENPRQVSAYRYPARYGPRSPTFSRAMLARLDSAPTLFISGTASIVGHESRHPGDVAGQLDETITNIRSLLDEARKIGLSERGELYLKAYLRHPEHLEQVRDGISRRLGDGARTVFLRADICRPELLMEIEAVWLPASASAEATS